MMKENMKRIYAHRGMSSLAPENTLLAFRLCAEHRVAWFECDIDILSDGTIVVFHDDTLERCTDGSGPLFAQTRASLNTLDAGSWFSPRFAGERVPTLAQLIALMNRCRLNANIEIKPGERTPEATASLLKGLDAALDRLDAERQYLISSFDPSLVGAFKQQRPQADVACLFENEALNDGWRETMARVGATAIHPQNEGLTRCQVEAFKAAGFLVNVWTVNDAQRARELFEWGVDGIFTDYAQEFVD
ncbi:Glycerophosphoryl diester phosphodiesterase [Leminorella grimontii]|nr:glycerophosphoryl diester phosphodiesterase [Leminorella grimontii ATCC 33999 = DSM 5078]VFS56806.1 Glycerophosphoryl diester phosphodiesterase [Leminorella grimontii]